MLDRKIVDEVIQSVPLADLMREDGRELRGAGGGHITRCVSPAHEDKTPSMSVFNGNHMKCFGCSYKGNSIDYLRDARGMDFVSAVNYLAGRGGISLPENWQSKKSAEKPAAGPSWQQFADSLMKNAKKSEEAQAAVGRGEKAQKLSAMGVGFFPAEIKEERWVRFLDRQPPEFLGAAGITKKEGGGYAGAGRHAWALRDAGITTGFSFFDPAGGEADVRYFPKYAGRGCAAGEGQAWAGKRHACVNVTNNPALAVKLHGGADKWGPAAYLPMLPGEEMGGGVFQSLARFRKIRFIADNRRALATFAMRALYVISDKDEIKLMHLSPDAPLQNRGVWEDAQHMSVFLEDWIGRAPAGIKNGEMFLAALRDNERGAEFYRSLLGAEMRAAIKARQARESGYADLERGGRGDE